MSTWIAYDVRIWEEIRPKVEWKTRRLASSVCQEISKDPSLAQFQNKQPVPWQLKEIMGQRANAWVQSLYNLCREANEDRGKTLSAPFDRAVWAFVIEPFIMGEDQLLELLLSAVGSPPERRSPLKVSQKDCCLAVRLKVFRTWHDKLHHLTPEILEAAAAMARANAWEARVARIAAGLPPEPSPPPQARITPLASSSTDGPFAPRPAADQGLNKELLPALPLEKPPQTNRVRVATWNAIEISFLSDERVQIRNGTNSETRNYEELGFADGRDGKPNRAWITLRAMAEQRGIIRDPIKTDRMWPKVEKRIQEIRKALREHFGISADPIPFVEGTGYRASFKIRCGPSFDT